MFNVGGGELAVILLLALVFLGPERLPQAARQFGRFMAEYRRMAAGFKSELREAMDLPGGTMGDLKQMVDTVRNPLDAITRPPASPTPQPSPSKAPDLGVHESAPDAAPAGPEALGQTAVGDATSEVRATTRPELDGPEQSFS